MKKKEQKNKSLYIPKAYIINGAHVLCYKKPSKKTVKALSDMIILAKKLK